VTDPAPTPPLLTGAELDQAILAAARALIAARLSRDPVRIGSAQAEYDRLLAMKYAGG
jgi:hypothetical protein